MSPRLLATLLLTFLVASCGPSGGGGDTPSGEMTLPGPGEAAFRVTFTGTWTAGSHPGDIPPGAHFSPLVGCTHQTIDILWAFDGASVATPGIEDMAETGGTTIVLGEIDGYITAGGAYAEVLTGAILATATTSTTFLASETHSLLSVTSMVAPSPDWFVGIRNVDLRPGGVWIDRLEFDLSAVYDAGTDSGTTFQSGDADVTPHDPIHLVADDGVHFLGSPAPVARVVIERLP